MTDSYGDIGGELDPGVLYTASAVPLDLTPVPAGQVVAGAPKTGSLDLDEDMGMGIWEMTPGAMRDVEIDELAHWLEPTDETAARCRGVCGLSPR